MKRVCLRSSKGSGYKIHGKHYDKCKGSRAEVGHGTAYRTAGGLVRKDIKKNKNGRWVSVKLSKLAKNDNRLKKAGYFTKKGVFGSFRKTKKVKGSKKAKSRKSKKSRKSRRN